MAGYTVYEAINEARREIFVGATTGLVSEAIRGLLDDPPPSLASWSPEEISEARVVESGLSERLASDFIARYVKTPLPESWRYLTAESPAAPPPPARVSPAWPAPPRP